mgnify:CR=1 FL=1
MEDYGYLRQLPLFWGGQLVSMHEQPGLEKFNVIHGPDALTYQIVYKQTHKKQFDFIDQHHEL